MISSRVCFLDCAIVDLVQVVDVCKVQKVDDASWNERLVQRFGRGTLCTLANK